MGLTLVTGDRNAGKTGEVYRRAREAAAAGASVAVLVPSLPERDRAASEFGADFPARIAVETLDSFLSQLWEQWGDGRRIVGEAERLIHVDGALERSRAAWEGRMPATALRRALPSLVQRAAERQPGKSLQRPTQPAAAAIVAAVEAYERLLRERGLIEPAAAHGLAAAAVPRQGLPDVICVNRFETFTPPQSAFLEMASRKTDVIVALTHVPGSSVTSAVDEPARRLAALAETTVHVEAAPVDTERELVMLQAGLAAGKPAAVAEGAVALIGAEGTTAEAEAAAQAIQEMVDSGIEADRIALVARRIGQRMVALAQTLEARGVPWRYEGTWRFRDSGFGRSAMALARLATRGRREDLVAFLQSGYAGASPEETDEFLRLVRRHRPSHGDELWRLALRAPGDAGRVLSSVAAVRRDAQGQDALAVLRRVADEMLAYRYGSAPVLGQEGRLDARCRQKMLEAAEAVIESSGRLDLEALVRVLDRTSVTVEDHGSGVVVSSPERIRSRRFDGLVVIGLQSDELPRAASGLGLPRSLVDALEAAGIDAKPRTDLEAERLLFYQTVTAARKRLVLVWQDRDDAGRERERSLFVDELIDAYREPSGLQAGEGGGLHGSRAGASTQAGEDDAGTPRLARRVWDGADLGSDLREALSQREVFAASELESYLQCPRLWFYRHVVKAEGLDVEIDVRHKGRIAHAILQRFYQKWQELGAKRVRAADLPRALQVHAEVAESVVADGAVAESLDERAQIERAVRGSRAVIVHDAESFPGFEPAAHEAVLAAHEPWSDFGGWRLSGRVDRIDVGEQGLIVSDYKSSTAPKLSWQRFERSGVLQAPLYAAAASRMLGLPVAGMIYRAMSWNGKDRGAYLEGVVSSPWLTRSDALDAAGIESVIAEAVERADAAVAGIRSGLIPCEPLDKDTCRSCPARPWCGRAEA
ncbi:MAG: PD-(D/E)XK nuclease family protein [Anaerosomatales bacterium]|nr:PD-(D/E)XK nuclease family protein [Anaerosomatales bacterium]